VHESNVWRYDDYLSHPPAPTDLTQCRSCILDHVACDGRIAIDQTGVVPAL
jgi:hypothetical protein